MHVLEHFALICARPRQERGHPARRVLPEAAVGNVRIDAARCVMEMMRGRVAVCEIELRVVRASRRGRLTSGSGEISRRAHPRQPPSLAALPDLDAKNVARERLDQLRGEIYSVQSSCQRQAMQGQWKWAAATLVAGSRTPSQAQQSPSSLTCTAGVSPAPLEATLHFYKLQAATAGATETNRFLPHLTPGRPASRQRLELSSSSRTLRRRAGTKGKAHSDNQLHCLCRLSWPRPRPRGRQLDCSREGVGALTWPTTCAREAPGRPKSERTRELHAPRRAHCSLWRKPTAARQSG